MQFAVPTVRFLENSDEHGRNVLQEIFGLCTLENFGVLLQFVGDLINDEAAANREPVMSLLQQRALFVDLQNAKRDARNDIIARVDTASAQFQWKARGVVVDNMDARVVTKLALQIARESRVELEEQQLTIPPHPARDFTGMHPFARTVLGDYAGAVEIDFIGDALDQPLGARHNRCDLKGAFQKSLEEQGAHRKSNSHPLSRRCPVASAPVAPECSIVRLLIAQRKD